MPRGVYERANAKPEPIHIDYWDIIEAALTSLPEDGPYRVQALAAFDHLKERVLANYAAYKSGPAEDEAGVEQTRCVGGVGTERSASSQRVGCVGGAR